jgi:hypothetical protein
MGHSPSKIAALAVVMVGDYLQLVEWVDLFPWNDVRHGNAQATLDMALGVATVILAIWLYSGDKIAALLGAGALGAWAWLQIESWWLPYFNGASTASKRAWEFCCSETIHVLPQADGRLPPDANHLVLLALIAVALSLVVRALFSTERESRI